MVDGNGLLHPLGKFYSFEVENILTISLACLN